MTESKGKDQCLAHMHSLMSAAIHNWDLQQSEDFSKRLESLSSSDSRFCKGYYVFFPSVNTLQTVNILYTQTA